MTNKQIEIFLRLADNLNFAKTARELYTTQPTVTREIKSLEEEIHVRLFKRDKHSVELTPAGMAFRECPDSKYTYCYDMQEVTMLMRAGFGVGVFPQYSVRPMEGCHIIPLSIHLKEPSAIDYYAMWHKDRPELHAGQFVALMQSLYREQQA